MKTAIAEKITGITLLTNKQYNDARPFIPGIADCWWLRQTGKGADPSGIYVYPDGTCRAELVAFRMGIRPALQFAPGSELPKAGSRFRFDEHTWTVIPGDMAICEETIGMAPYQKKWAGDDPLNYEASDAKRYLDMYLSRAMALDANNGKPFDIVLCEREIDCGLTKTELDFLMEAVEHDAEMIPFEIPDYISTAMGFITRDAAERIGYDYGQTSRLAFYIQIILDDMNLESETQTYHWDPKEDRWYSDIDQIPQGTKTLAIWLTR